MGAQVIGIGPDAFIASAVAQFRLGSIGGYDDPVDGYKEYIYGQNQNGATSLGQLCAEGAASVFTPVTTANTAGGQLGGHGTRVGAAVQALAANQFGWFQIYGRGAVLTAAAVAVGTRLNTTATAGAIDDDGTAGARAINGLVLKTAAGGAVVAPDARFSYPTVGVTI